MINSKTFANL